MIGGIREASVLRPDLEANSDALVQFIYEDDTQKWHNKLWSAIDQKGYAANSITTFVTDNRKEIPMHIHDWSIKKSYYFLIF